MLALVVEDEIAIAMLYQRILEQVNFDVLTATDGNEAIQHLEAHTPQLILLDIRLPLVNGLDVLNYMAATPRLQGSHVVIATSSQEFQRYTTLVNSAEFLLKPIRPQQIQVIANRLSG